MVGGLKETNLMISIFLVLILMVVSRVRKVLNEAGTWAAAGLGLGVAIAGHWSWLIILLSFLTAGFAATKWRYSEKSEKGVIWSPVSMPLGSLGAPEGGPLGFFGALWGPLE